MSKIFSNDGFHQMYKCFLHYETLPSFLRFRSDFYLLLNELRPPYRISICSGCFRKEKQIAFKSQDFDSSNAANTNGDHFVTRSKFFKCDIYLVRIFISPKAIQLHIYLAYLEHYLTGAREREWSIWRECFCF